MLQHELDSRGVATLCLDRPQLHNAFDDTLIAELNRVLSHYAADPAVRVLVLRSNGKSFSAGADLNWMKRVAQYDFDDNLRDSQALAELMERIYRFPNKKAIPLASNPLLIESSPSDGPTTLSSIIFTGALSAPALRIISKRCASSAFCIPVICELPPVIF